MVGAKTTGNAQQICLPDARSLSRTLTAAARQRYTKEADR